MSTGSGAPAQYSTLAAYNAGSIQGIRPPVPASVVTGAFVVPAYGAPGYAVLQHGAGTVPAVGYFNVGEAYGADAVQCGTRYKTSACQ